VVAWRTITGEIRSVGRFVHLVRARVLGALGPVDVAFALLRAVVVGGSIGWLLLAPIPAERRNACAILIATFVGYSLVLYGLIFWRPRGLRHWYAAALAADLPFLFLLFRFTGGVGSPFVPATFLLVALHSFYYGPVAGLGVAAAVSLCCGLSDPAAVAGQHWTTTAIVPTFLALLALYVGWLSRVECREREAIQNLDHDLMVKGEDLKTAYQRVREMQEHMIHSERLATIGKMAAEIAHQIRNPLSSISLNLELLGDELSNGGPADVAEAWSLLKAIETQTEELVQITENYLQFARLPRLHWQKVSLGAVLQELVDMMAPECHKRGIVMHHQFDAALPELWMDRRQLKFAISNLMMNSLEAMRPGGRLRLAAHRNGQEVLVSVSDTGGGIRPEDRPKILHPFFTTRERGTGLGLSLAQRIIKSHDGRLTFESMLRVGTTFTAHLPLNYMSGEERDRGESFRYHPRGG